MSGTIRRQIGLDAVDLLGHGKQPAVSRNLEGWKRDGRALCGEAYPGRSVVQDAVQRPTRSPRSVSMADQEPLDYEEMRARLAEQSEQLRHLAARAEEHRPDFDEQMRIAEAIPDEAQRLVTQNLIRQSQSSQIHQQSINVLMQRVVGLESAVLGILQRLERLEDQASP